MKMKGVNVVFTGIVEEVGRVRQLKQTHLAMELVIECEQVLEGTRIGDSIAVNGVCLTATEIGSRYFRVDVMPESVKRTHFHCLKLDEPVNLERALRVGDRLGGHFVQGHVDTTAILMERTPYENAEIFRFQIDQKWTRLMIEKGSIAINGISLTLVEVNEEDFTVSLIPHTLEQTQLRFTKPGDMVNVECDMIGKYLAKWMNASSQKPSQPMVEVFMNAGVSLGN